MLTIRQRAIVFGLSAGLSLAEIATRLKMSAATVADHRKKLGRKLDIVDGNIVLLLRAAVAAGELPRDVLAQPVASLLRKMRGSS